MAIEKLEACYDDTVHLTSLFSMDIMSFCTYTSLKVHRNKFVCFW